MKTMWSAAAIGAAFVMGFLARGVVSEPVEAQSARVFELRTYTAPDGKLEELHKRFRDHTMRIFKNHNITNIAYFRPQDAPLSQNTLIYLIAHPSREAAKADWAAFQQDPEWQKVANESQKNGKIVAKVESVFLDPTDYSPMK
ncbi:MAG TPA: NIPSNAP family protein [Vicinamibacterales bacterium]|nr:NIPSNAP family protein [Vicinamibacterales bacterium]